MAGLDLQPLLRLLRADVGAWVSLLVICGLFGLMAWTSWGSRRALRKCLVLSVLTHLGLVFYGSTVPGWGFRRLSGAGAERLRRSPAEATAQIRLVSAAETDRRGGGLGELSAVSTLPDWDRTESPPLMVADPVMRPDRAPTPRPRSDLPPPMEDRVPANLPPAIGSPEVAPTGSDALESRSVTGPPAEASLPEGPVRPAEIDEPPSRPISPASPSRAPMVPPETDLRPRRPSPRTVVGHDPERRDHPGTLGTNPGRTLVGPTAEPLERRAVSPPEDRLATVAVEGDDVAPLTTTGPYAGRTVVAPAVPEIDARRRIRGTVGNLAERFAPALPAIPPPDRVLPNVAPGAESTPGPGPSRSRGEVPEVYRSRLDPDRSARALQAGASTASEQAVERALDWLRRHQDADGRWDGGTARYADGTDARGEGSFTRHCPPGEICFGECFYAEADTALTGLALLAYLGAGYTHKDGRYAEVVARGLEFLLSQQKPDGDLRGMSRAVGMYCHAMAALAVCEAYALTGDDRLRGPVERAVAFTLKARSADGMAWRYLPGDTRGSDTSILGWVIMLLKSAREVGIVLPPSAQAGALTWLDKVAGGQAGGLARYQPVEIARSRRDSEITPTMTAEAWVCRQFLGVGGPGSASDEAAAYLLQHPPEHSPFNIYYWYYGTLAMYQHGGEPWNAWNAQVRDQLVRRQRTEGHQVGSWDPDETDYGTRGGRIYGTALAALTLEVYYRYLRLYDSPAKPSVRFSPASPSPPRTTRPGD